MLYGALGNDVLLKWINLIVDQTDDGSIIVDRLYQILSGGYGGCHRWFEVAFRK